MMGDTKYWRTILKAEVLSEGKNPPDFGGDLNAVNSAITDGECSGIVTEETVEITPQEMAQSLMVQGSDPGFLGLSDDGTPATNQDYSENIGESVSTKGMRLLEELEHAIDEMSHAPGCAYRLAPAAECTCVKTHLLQQIRPTGDRVAKATLLLTDEILAMIEAAYGTPEAADHPIWLAAHSLKQQLLASKAPQSASPARPEPPQ
jgi:hypothetical protein